MVRITYGARSTWAYYFAAIMLVPFTARKQTFHPTSIFVFSPGIFVFGTKGTISPGCILKQGYKVYDPSVWRRRATISPGYSP